MNVISRWGCYNNIVIFISCIPKPSVTLLFFSVNFEKHVFSLKKWVSNLSAIKGWEKQRVETPSKLHFCFENSRARFFKPYYIGATLQKQKSNTLVFSCLQKNSVMTVPRKQKDLRRQWSVFSQNPVLFFWLLNFGSRPQSSEVINFIKMQILSNWFRGKQRTQSQAHFQLEACVLSPAFYKTHGSLTSETRWDWLLPFQVTKCTQAVW